MEQCGLQKFVGDHPITAETPQSMDTATISLTLTWLGISASCISLAPDGG